MNSMDKAAQAIVAWIRGAGSGRRMTIGISGHGASGKTTFTRRLAALLGEDNVNILNTDPYIVGSHLRKFTLIDYDYRHARYQEKMTACHPAAHHRFALERDLHMMRDGLDFYTIGTEYTERSLISARNDINLVEGMTVAFTDPSLYDLRVYLYTDGETELGRRSLRDVALRGRDLNDLLQSHEGRRRQYELFMHPCGRSFDMVILNSDDDCKVEKSDLKR